MEFEKSLFRVYERTVMALYPVSGLNNSNNNPVPLSPAGNPPEITALAPVAVDDTAATSSTTTATSSSPSEAPSSSSSPSTRLRNLLYDRSTMRVEAGLWRRRLSARWPQSTRDWLVVASRLYAVVAIISISLLVLLHVAIGEGSNGACIAAALRESRVRLDAQSPVVESWKYRGNETQFEHLLPLRPLLSDDLIRLEYRSEGRSRSGTPDVVAATRTGLDLSKRSVVHEGRRRRLLGYDDEREGEEEQGRDDLETFEEEESDDQQHELLKKKMMRREREKTPTTTIDSIPDDELSSNDGDKDIYEFSADPTYVLMKQNDRGEHRVTVTNVTLDLNCILPSGGGSFIRYVIGVTGERFFFSSLLTRNQFD